MDVKMRSREPFLLRGGWFRLVYLVVAIWACREFALWLDPIVAKYMLGREAPVVRTVPAENPFRSGW